MVALLLQRQAVALGLRLGYLVGILLGDGELSLLESTVLLEVIPHGGGFGIQASFGYILHVPLLLGIDSQVGIREEDLLLRRELTALLCCKACLQLLHLIAHPLVTEVYFGQFLFRTVFH